MTARFRCVPLWCPCFDTRRYDGPSSLSSLAGAKARSAPALSRDLGVKLAVTHLARCPDCVDWVKRAGQALLNRLLRAPSAGRHCNAVSLSHHCCLRSATCTIWRCYSVPAAYRKPLPTACSAACAVCTRCSNVKVVARQRWVRSFGERRTSQQQQQLKH